MEGIGDLAHFIIRKSCGYTHPRIRRILGVGRRMPFPWIRIFPIYRFNTISP